MPSPDYVIKSSDSAPPITVTCSNQDGTPVDLTNATSAKFLMAIPGQAAKIDAAGAISGTPTNGQVTYTWQAGDLDTPARYAAEVEVTWTGGTVSTYPGSGYLDILVTRELG